MSLHRASWAVATSLRASVGTPCHRQLKRAVDLKLKQMPPTGQMPEEHWDYTQCCVSPSLAPSQKLKPWDVSWIHACLILAQWQDCVEISFTTAVEPSDSCIARSSFPSDQNSGIKQTWNFFGRGNESLSCKTSSSHWHQHLPFHHPQDAPWGICRKQDSNDVTITHKVQQGEADLESELECSAVFFFISKSLLYDEWNLARLITFLTMKPQRQIH